MSGGASESDVHAIQMVHGWIHVRPSVNLAHRPFTLSDRVLPYRSLRGHWAQGSLYEDEDVGCIVVLGLASIVNMWNSSHLKQGR